MRLLDRYLPGASGSGISCPDAVGFPPDPGCCLQAPPTGGACLGAQPVGRDIAIQATSNTIPAEHGSQCIPRVAWFAPCLPCGPPCARNSN